MPRLARALVLALALLLVPLAPAQAGDGYWSPSGCAPPPPVPVEWWGVPGQGSWYRSQYGTFWVGGTFHSWFASDNWECGHLLGVPLGNVTDLYTVSPLYRPGEWHYQDFYFGRLLRRFDGEWFIYRYYDGNVFPLGQR